MKRKIRFFFFMFFIGLFLASGCRLFDVFNAKSKKLIGGLYLIQTNQSPVDTNYYLIFRREGQNDKYIFKDYEFVNSLTGDDTIVVIKTQIDTCLYYHLIKHLKGDTIVSIEKLTTENFLIWKRALNAQYSFPFTRK